MTMKAYYDRDAGVLHFWDVSFNGIPGGAANHLDVTEDLFHDDPDDEVWPIVVSDDGTKARTWPSPDLTDRTDKPTGTQWELVGSIDEIRPT